MKKIKLLSLAILLLVGFGAMSQTISFSGQLGYSKAKGDLFSDPNGNEFFSIGLGYEGDLLYFPDLLGDRLGIGICYYNSVLFGQTGSGAFDIATYGLGLYGVKGQLRLFDVDSKVSPYFSLGLGLSHLETPQWTSGTDVLVPADHAFSIGLRPEVGIELGGLILSVSYFTPMKYSVESLAGEFKGTAGSFTIGLGYRYFLDI